MEQITQSVQEQESKSVKDRIIEAIQNSDLETLESELRNINFLLTGRDHSGHFDLSARDELRQILSQLLTVATKKEGRESKIVYLGDGGLSRLVLKVTDGKVTVDLTNNSPECVKEKWAKEFQ